MFVPLLVGQPASPSADLWYRADRAVALWTLTPVEVTSALWRLVRDKALDEPTAQAAEARADELTAASHVVVDVDRVRALSRRLLRTHPLRAADALQLGAALAWSGGQATGKTFHTLDGRLAVAARREGFDVPS